MGRCRARRLVTLAGTVRDEVLDTKHAVRTYIE
jgi:hypothetical protein